MYTSNYDKHKVMLQHIIMYTRRRPGIDGLKIFYLTKIGLNNITACFNIYLISSTAPSAFKLGLTTLIPKTKHSTEPYQYRPITVSSILGRVLHKMLPRRIENNRFSLLSVM